MKPRPKLSRAAASDRYERCVVGGSLFAGGLIVQVWVTILAVEGGLFVASPFHVTTTVLWPLLLGSFGYCFCAAVASASHAKTAELRALKVSTR